jgi:hypothetical protein
MTAVTDHIAAHLGILSGFGPQASGWAEWV